MNTKVLRRTRHPLLTIAALALLASCSDVTSATEIAQTDPPPNLAGCENLKVPMGNQVSYHAYARGFQIYRWTDTAWTFVSPSATLYADSAATTTIGSHYAGPTWESATGSRVVGAALARCIPNPNAVPWLLLGVVSSSINGMFGQTTFIQRVNTVGGNAPTQPGIAGQEVSVPYTAEYFFYR